MEINASTLLDCLKPHLLRSTLKYGEKIAASAIGLIGKEDFTTAGDILYIGYVSDLPPDIGETSPLVLICIENITLPDAYSESHDISLVVLDDRARLQDVYNTVNALFVDERLIEQATDRLFKAVVTGAGIQEICDIGYGLLDNPVAVLDNGLKHIAYTSDVDVDDAVWTEVKKNGYVSNETMLLFSAQNEFKQDFNQKTPFIMSKGQFRYRRMVSHIFVGQKAVGTLVVIESGRLFREVDARIAGLIVKVLSLEMKQSSFILYSKGLAYEHFFKDLLDGMHDVGLINDKLKTLHLQIKEDLYVLTIDISNFDSTYKTLQYFRDALDQMVADCKSIIYNDAIVMIIMRRAGQTLTETELKELGDFFAKNNLYGGVSKCFHNIADIQAHFDQSTAAAALGRRVKGDRRLSFYEDCLVYHLIDLAAQEADLQHLCSAPLLKLLEYDRQNNTPYAQNLYEYLINERNLAHTTIALHTHRNTLIYRLKKIEEIMQVDLEDSDVRLQLLITYKILELINAKT